MSGRISLQLKNVVIRDVTPPARTPGRGIRVVAVMDTSIVSGPGKQLAAIVGPLHEAGVEIHIITFQHTHRETSAYRQFLEQAGIDTTVVRYSRRFDRGLLPALKDAIDALDPDIVQTHSYRPTTLTWLLRNRYRPGWRWIGFFHGSTREDLKVLAYHWLDRRLLRSADRIVVMSRAQRQIFADAADRVVQVQNAVIPVGATAGSDPAPLVAGLSRPRIGVIGRLSHEKGVDVMLDAFAGVVRGGSEATLVVAGDGPDRPALIHQAERLGIASRVRFTGMVESVERLYPLLDLVVLPSRSEGLPNVLLEALRADRRVVATRVGAVPEVLDGTDAGVVVPSEDPEALAAAMTEALTEPQERRAAQRKLVAERFSLDRRVAAHVQLYNDVLSGVAP